MRGDIFFADPARESRICLGKRKIQIAELLKIILNARDFPRDALRRAQIKINGQVLLPKFIEGTNEFLKFVKSKQW